MSSILEIWKTNPDFFVSKSVEQVVKLCGDGELRDASVASGEFRELLKNLPSDRLAEFAAECLETSFRDGGFALQDIVNQIGTRLGYLVIDGRYRGIRNEIGFDGIWTGSDDYRLIVEIKTTDTYRINLDTIAAYRAKLIADGQLTEDRSSILIVVGRQDTGDLEAQIRGSRHAWDIRLISTDALIRLMSLKGELSDWATSVRINEILKPVEYTRVDAIIDLIFTTSGDLQDDNHRGGPTMHASAISDEPPSEPQFDTAGLRVAAAQMVAAHLGTTFIKKGKVFFTSTDSTVGLICLASQPYEHTNYTTYWYGFKPGQNEFLAATGQAYVALACGSSDRILLIPKADFLPLLQGMNETTDTHWHVKVFLRDGKYQLDQPKKGPRFDVTRYLITAHK